MYTKDSKKELKKVNIHFWSKDSKFKEGTENKTFVVYDAEIQEVYILVTNFLNEKAQKIK